MLDCKAAIEQTGILPVINITEKELALPLAKALIDGGINALEVTLRSESSLESIAAIKERYPDFILGAGTVLSTEQVDAALNAGVDFIVCPGNDPEIINYCLAKHVPVIPGCVTPSEIQEAVKKGVTVLKFFPAELSGGLEAIKLLSGPFPNVRFIPTGGINYGNLGSYLSNPKILAAGGSYMATAKQLKERDFAGITEACKKALQISLGFELAHVGINHENEQQAVDTASGIAGLFGLGVRKGNSSVFAGSYVEAMKMKFYGTKGHIGFYTNSVFRSMAWFEKNGIKVKKESIRKDEKGALQSAYLEDEIGGFAIHVTRRN